MSALQALFSPSSVCVIGASRNPRSVGATILKNLLDGSFQGPVYPVNPSASFVLSVPCWPSVEAIEGHVDLAVIVVPAPYVLDMVEACGRKGVRGLIIITAGFGELGGDGVSVQHRITRRVRELGMRMVGPNCLGLVNTHPSVSLNATFAPSVWMPRTAPPGPAPRGNVAFSSQSGALGVAILDTARQLGIGISQFVSVGNNADVSGNDLLLHWQGDPNTDVILLYLESFGNPQRFAEIAHDVSLTKPIVAVKSGRTRSGAMAASSHTGALAGVDRIADALFERTGVIRVDTVEELFDTAMLLANQPLPGGDRCAIVTNAGGPGILATDALEARGLSIARFQPATIFALEAVLPEEASTQNPVDMIASAGPESMRACLDAVLADPGVDAVLALFVPPGQAETERVAQAIVAASDKAPTKPVLSCFMGTHGVPAALRSLSEGHVPSYAFPEAAARALARAVGYGSWLATEHDPPRYPAGVDLDRAGQALVQVDSEGWLSAEACDALLDAYGIPRVSSRVVPTREGAVAAADALGLPVVMKAIAPGLVHKSDLGGVLLDLRDARAVGAGWDQLQVVVGDALEGALVQPMLSGHEVIIGMTRDPAAGPVLMFGIGGVLVELMEDVAFALPPVTGSRAMALIDAVRAKRLLEGYRGGPKGDKDALVDLIGRVSLLATNHPELAELDLNPVMVGEPGQGATVVDARFRVEKNVH